MSHARKQIRDALVSALTGLATTGSNVFESKISKFADSQIPALDIWTPEDSYDTAPDGGSYGGADGKQMSVEIRIKAKRADGIIEALDAIEVEVFDAIMADDTLGGLVKRLQLVGSRLDLDEEEQKVGTLTSLWGCYYVHDSTDLESLV